jgi:hypothetical protein
MESKPMTTRRVAEQSESSLGAKILLGVLIAVVPAIFGYVVSFANSVRTAKLATVNQQIEKLYGPLYALTQANDVTWEHFARSNWPNRSRYYFDPRDPPSPEQVTKWRQWMRSVFQPLNMQMERVIVNNSQLIIGTGMPQPFKDVIAQTEGYKAVIAAWSDADKNNLDAYKSPDENTTDMNYPSEFGRCVSASYDGLKQRQHDLQVSYFSALWVSSLSAPGPCNSKGQ